MRRRNRPPTTERPAPSQPARARSLETGPRAGRTAGPWIADLRVGGGQREGQRLRVGAGAKRVPVTDGLLETDGGRVVGRRTVEGLQRGRRGGVADRRVRSAARAPGLPG